MVDYISIYLVHFVSCSKKPKSNGLMEFIQLQNRNKQNRKKPQYPKLNTGLIHLLRSRTTYKK